MKRAGGLFERICTDDALVAAYHRASQRKHNHRSCHEFGRRLGSNIESLAEELLSGDYRPHPCNRFWIHEPKPRLIEAPAFRDLVVQHAVHAAASPEFERRYIDTNFACRTGKGTHAAADWLHAALRRADDTAWVLHIDVRKFFYSIDRDVLTAQIARVIKCRRTLGLMAMFAWRPDATGVPIGNLLSQTFANVYLNALDHYAKRGLGLADYGRYMDDSIMIVRDRADGLSALGLIRRRLADLRLEISHYSLQPIKRGANFVGFRTWRRGRFVRPSVLNNFRRAARKGQMDGVISRLGHARHTCSFRPMTRHLETHHHDLYRQLPQSLRPVHHVSVDRA
jgi:RNA-directed DNA polymerase